VSLKYKSMSVKEDNPFLHDNSKGSDWQ